jgi:hypothetical protein
MATGSVKVLEDARVYVAGLDLSGQANDVTMAAAAAMNDVTTYGSEGWQEQRPGLKSSKLDVVTFLSESLVGTTLDPGGSALICTVVEDDSQDAVGYSFSGLSMSLGREGKIGEVFRQPINLAGTGRAFDGELILPRATRTAGASGTARQFGAVASGEAVYASLHIFSATGGTVTATVQSDDSSGFGSPTSRIAFAGASSGAQQLSTAGAITDSWWRVTWTQTASSASFAVLVGIQ